jgi:hypothetical protein
MDLEWMYFVGRTQAISGLACRIRATMEAQVHDSKTASSSQDNNQKQHSNLGEWAEISTVLTDLKIRKRMQSLSYFHLING